MDARLKRSGLTRWCKDTTTHIPMEGIKKRMEPKVWFFHVCATECWVCLNCTFSLACCIFNGQIFKRDGSILAFSFSTLGRENKRIRRFDRSISGQTASRNCCIDEGRDASIIMGQTKCDSTSLKLISVLLAFSHTKSENWGANSIKLAICKRAVFCRLPSFSCFCFQSYIIS